MSDTYPNEDTLSPAEALAQSRENRSKTRDLVREVDSIVGGMTVLRIENNWAEKIKFQWQGGEARAS